MSKNRRECQWCGEESPRWRGVVCSICESRTKSHDLYALIAEDRSCIAYLFENIADAQAVLKDDASNGIYALILRKVVGQAGARTELNDSRSPNADMWERIEQAQAVADFERSTS